MEIIQYKIIKTDAQYHKYCDRLAELVESGKKARAVQDEIELLALLIEKYDETHNSFDDLDPVQLLKALMKDHKMKAVDLARLLHVSEGLISDMMHYKKGFSKESIRTLATHFKVSQDAFNRNYPLKNAPKIEIRDAGRLGKRKKVVLA
jgi:HTH-type transcriptional regulator / antitoxin HigA